jgi:hypothetical protein
MAHLGPVLDCSHPSRSAGLEFRPGFRLLHPLARQIECHGGADEVLHSCLIDLLAFVDVDGAPYITLKAGVKQTGRVLQRSSFGEGQLDDTLVRLSRADDATM